MPGEYDDGKASLDALIEWADANDAGLRRNEAETRLHLIDDLLMSALGWPKSAVHPEIAADEGWIDYALGAPATRLVIEAKREGITFELPAGTRTGVHSIASLTDGRAGRPLRDAMIQVSRYAAANGVAQAGVTNGHQLILFIAVRTDSVKPLDGKALVFPSLADMFSEFRLLWDNTSPPGVESRRLHATLRSGVSAPPEPLSMHLNDYPGVQRRNDLQSGLEVLGELFLVDVARLDELREEFLTDCYASSGALSQYAEVSKQILQTRYSLLHTEASGITNRPAQGKRGLTPELTQDMLAAAASRRPIVLLGDVGVGKTTFIQRLVHVDAKELFSDAINIYIDFGTSTTLGRLDEFVVRESINQLRENCQIDIEEADFVEAVHNSALNRFDKGVVGRLKEVDPTAYQRARIGFLQERVSDRAEHLSLSLEHLHATARRQVVIFLDNIDQRNAADQDQVFLIANELASNWPATVFVTLRPESFYSSTHSGALSGYQPRVFTIAPPRTDVMLQRRFDFVLKQLSETGRLGSYPKGVTVDSESLQSFFEMLAENFRSNEPLLALIDNMAGGNMRMALSFVADFIGSGHIDTRKILDIYQQSPNGYKIPVHEFLRALLFGDRMYYDPESSPIANLLRTTQADGREHFLLPLLLNEIQLQGERGGQEGHVSADHVFSFAQGWGFTEEQIVAGLDFAVEKRLLDAAPRYTSDRPRAHFRITTVGAYTTRVILTHFAYVDAIVVDTPIMDSQYRGLLQDARTLADRLSRAEYFRTYLDREWNAVTAEGAGWQWPDVSERIRLDIRRIGSRTAPATWGRRR